MARRVTLADGTTYDNSDCGEGLDKLYCNIKGNYSFQSIASEFMDPEKTETITFEAGDVINTFNGYTEIISIVQNAAQAHTITLRKPGGD